MDPRIPSSWQLHPQDSQPPQQAHSAPPNLNYSHVPLGPTLIEIVARNDEVTSFASQYPTINRKCVPLKFVQRNNQSSSGMQHLLAADQYQGYLFYSDQAIVKADIEDFYRESVAFVHEQHLSVQGDLPYLTAYDYEVRNFELKLMADDSQVISAICLAAGYEESERTRQLNKSILLMMRSRAALLKRDVTLRRDLIHIHAAINKFSSLVIPLQLRIKYSMMTGMHDEAVVKEDSHQALKGLLPWNSVREQKCGDLLLCRETRVGLEKRLGEAKAHVQMLEQVRNLVNQENV